MNLLEKLETLMEERNLNQHSLSVESGVPYSTVRSFWEKGYEHIRISTIKAIARYFDVTIDYLVIDEITDPEYGKHTELTKSDRQLLAAYRRADERSKAMVDLALEPYMPAKRKDEAI